MNPWDKLDASAQTCSYCPNLCLHSCAVSNAERRSTVSPWAKMSAVRWFAGGSLTFDAEAAQVFHACTECGACTSACAHGVDVAAALSLARAAAVESFRAPHGPETFAPPAGAAMAAHAIRPAEVAARTALLPGCDALVSWPEAVSHAAALLEFLDLGPVGVVGRCCGGLEFSGGYRELLPQRARELGAELPPRTEWVSLSGGCHATVDKAWPAAGITTYAPRRLTEVLLEALAGGPHAWTPVPGRFAVADACIATRQYGEALAVRKLLGWACREPPADLRWTGQQSHCCGAGAPYARSNPEGAQAAAHATLQLAADCGADAVVSFDLTCAAHLRAAALDSRSAVSVHFGASLVAGALGIIGRGE